MRFGLAVALLFSVILIGGASWWRFGNVEATTPTGGNLIAVDTENLNSHEEILKELTTPKATSTLTTTPKPLTDTDIITRSLLMNYVGTSINGGGTVDIGTLNSIANQHVDEAANLHTFKIVSILDISVVGDSEANAKRYSEDFSKIYSTYTWEITLLTKNPNNTRALATAYQNMSNALKALPVPVSISLLHLRLVNNHASTAEAVRSMEKVETDPVKTIAGLTAIKENVLKETSTLAEIDRILREKYGNL